MLTDESVKDRIRSFYSAISTGLPGFKGRSGQRQMIGAIANALARSRGADDSETDGSNFIVVEGKTGVGKTIGYLVPALIMAKAQGKKLVVSTGTVSLQEQLFERDLPALQKLYPGTFTFALAKGRTRYVCLTRLAQFSGTQDGLFETSDEDSDEKSAVWDRKPEQHEIKLLGRLAEQFEARTWKGDRDSLDEAVAGDLWARVSTDSAGCSGRKCPAIAQCPYYAARKVISGVDVIVANHDLVLSCLASQSTLLPAPTETIYVFDEAHHLPEIAISRFSEAASVAGAARWVHRVPQLGAKTLAALPSFKSEGDLHAICSDLEGALKDVGRALNAGEAFEKSQTLRFPHGVLSDDFALLAEQVHAGTSGLHSAFSALTEAFSESMEEGSNAGPVADQLVKELGATMQRIEGLHAVWSMMMEERPEGVPPLAKWIEKTTSGDFMVRAAPICAASVLKHYLWSGASAVVLTSATLTTLGDFGFYLRNSGLDQYPAVTTLAVQSPFDYARQGTLCVPRLKHDPKNVEGHTAEIVEHLPSIVEQSEGGTLVLFASRRQMNDVYDRLPSETQQRILVQGSQSRITLLAEHRARVERDGSSVLFGLAGLGEGLDLPGRYCTHVVIAKIPFAPPDSPMEEALSEWIETNNGNPFAELTLPKAGLLLVQWVGRLIRTEEDLGRITIFDSRITSKSYGRRLLAGLPAFSRRSG